MRPSKPIDAPPPRHSLDPLAGSTPHASEEGSRVPPAEGLRTVAISPLTPHRRRRPRVPSHLRVRHIGGGLPCPAPEEVKGKRWCATKRGGS